MEWKKYRLTLAGIVFVIIFLIFFFILAINGWGGELTHCYDSGCFCEEMCDDCLILEPVNTWSNVYYFLSGLAILLILDKSRNKRVHGDQGDQGDQRIQDQSKPNNPMENPSVYSILYAFTVLNIGLGSWLFHANMRDYGGFWDIGAMNMYMGYLLIYIVARDFNKSTQWFVIVFSLVNVGIFIQVVFDPNPENSSYIFIALVALASCLEILGLLFMKIKGDINGYIRDWRIFFAGLLVFLFGYSIWNLTNTGNLYCNPSTFWQGHGFWHFFTAFTTFIFFIYMKSEKKVGESSYQ
jgi:Ceramidase